MSTSAPGTFFSLSDLGLPTSQAQFLQLWLAAMQAQYGSSFSPSAGDLDYVQAQVFASQAADVAQLCVSGATELFRQFGTQLLGLAYQQGDASVAIVQIDAADDAGYTLPAQTPLTLTLSGATLGFQTSAALTIPEGDTSGQVGIYAVQSGSSFNGAGAPAQLVAQIDWVSSVSVVTNASGGVDQQSDDQYLVDLANTLQLLAPRPITASDYATMAINFVPALGTDQQEVGRATSIDGYSPAVTDFTGTTNGTETVSDVSSFTGVTVGSIIAATDITAGQTVTAIDTDASTVTLSAAASGSHSSEAMTSTGSYGNERTMAVCITDTSGDALNDDTVTAVQAYLEALREANFIVNVLSPDYSTIYVSCTVIAAPGYSAATVQANVQTALLQYLTPQNFGLPIGALAGWANSQTIYLSRVESVIQNALGVASIPYGLLAVDVVSPPANTTADLVLPGPFPLPVTSTDSIPTSAITVQTS